MASVQIRIPRDSYNIVLAEKGRLSIGGFVAELIEEAVKRREELKKKSTKK